MQKIPKVFLFLHTTLAPARRLLRGISNYAKIHGPWALYRAYPEELKHDWGIMDYIDAWKPDGVIIRAPSTSLRSIRNLKIPAILSIHSKNYRTKMPKILVNNYQVAELAVDYFLQKKFKHYAYVGYGQQYWAKERGKRFVEKLREKECPCFIYESVEDNISDWNLELEFISNWIATLPKPLALFACNDSRAHQVIEACHMGGIVVPNEVAVLGVDNDDMICDLIEPPLSSIMLQTEQGGYEAAELLDQMLEGVDVQKNIMISPSHVVERTSTGVFAVEDKEIAMALNYIKRNVYQPVQVDDLLLLTGLSRTSFYTRFRNAVGVPVYNEIKRIRVQHISTYLASTELPIKIVAERFGFKDDKHFSRYFKHATGLTPGDYRKKIKKT